MAEVGTRAEPDPSHGDTWVVGVDGSECSRRAALWASANIEQRATELQLVSAWSMAATAGMSPMNPLITSSTLDALAEASTATVSALARDLTPPAGVAVTTGVGRCGAATLLLDAADDAELLVVGSRGRGGFARLVLGSTSTQCATHSSAPVAIIPSTTPATRPRSIVVGFDGSPNSVAALEWTLDFADPGSSIDCTFVWDAAPLTVGSDQFFFPEASDLACERFEHLVATASRAHRRTAVDVRSIFVEGSPRAALSAAATACDLLVTGARGHGAIGAAVLGSVSTWLLHNVHTAMVVVPQERREPEAGDRAVGDHELGDHDGEARE